MTSGLRHYWSRICFLFRIQCSKIIECLSVLEAGEGRGRGYLFLQDLWGRHNGRCTESSSFTFPGSATRKRKTRHCSLGTREQGGGPLPRQQSTVGVSPWSQVFIKQLFLPPPSFSPNLLSQYTNL